MSWITVIWSMVASACLTLAAMHLFIWFKKAHGVGPSALFPSRLRRRQPSRHVSCG